MWRDAEKSLAHDNECRHVDEGIWGQIVKIDPVIIHDAANEWVEGKPKPADKMREKYNPLVGFRSRDDLSRRRKTVANSLGQIPAPQSLLISFSRTVEAIHLPPAPDPDIFGKPFWAEERSVWALGLERKGMDE